MTSPFVSVSALTDQLAGPTPPVVLDASLVLHAAAFDGDYRRDNGRPRWVQGHIPGSRHVDVATQFSDTSAPLHYTHPQPQPIADELARLGVARDTAVVVYDSTGTLWAARLWYLLRWIGHEVHVLDGGFAAWRAAGGPIDVGEDIEVWADAPLGSRGSRRPVASWKAATRRDYWVSMAELAERSATDGRSLVCGLANGAFTGADPTRYSRRGHIPGSINVSSRGLFDTDGTVKSRVELVLAYKSAGVDVSENSPEVLLYCGGGISAAANALTLAEIGKTDVRIYDGSLEEWSASDRELIVG